MRHAGREGCKGFDAPPQVALGLRYGKGPGGPGSRPGHCDWIDRDLMSQRPPCLTSWSSLNPAKNNEGAPSAGAFRMTR